MEIEYNLTEDDYLHFTLYHLKHSKTGSRALLVQRFIGSVIFLIAAYFFSTIGDISFPELFTIYLIISVLWFFFYPKYYYNFVRRNTLKMIREGKTEGLLGGHRLVLSDEGLVESTSVNETKIPWAGIFEFKEDDEFFYLYNGPISAYIIPKTQLDHAAGVKGFLQKRLQS